MKLIQLILIYCLLLFSLNGFSQSGPGGVGNSSNNGLWLIAGSYIGSDGDSITSWQDTSGNNLNAIQTTIGREPRFYNSSALNGQPIIRFDGSNDEMNTPDANILDNSTGITYFVVLRPNNLDNNPRGILGKRISFGENTNYAYTWFFYNSRYLNLDINTQNNRFTTNPTSFSNSSNYIFSMQYDGTLSSGVRSRIYSGTSLLTTSSETSSTILNSNIGVCIGALNSNYGTYLGADYAEIIQFNFALTDLQRLIVNNYLSAKYNIPLSSNDIYTLDDPANGNYDFEVAGIAQIDASNFQDNAIGIGRLGVSNPSDLDDDEYLFWGHDNGNGKDYSDIPVGVDARLTRVWRFSETDASLNPVDVGSIDIRWNLTNTSPVTAGELRLLIDSDNDGTFSDETPISGATNIGGDVYEFTGITGISNNTRLTLATIDESSTSLPITLLYFELSQNDRNVEIEWETKTEINNHFFEIEKSTNLNEWSLVDEVLGSGTSNSPNIYKSIDSSPSNGINYYRLKQVDFDGQTEYFNPKAINVSNIVSGHSIYPNPTKNEIFIKGVDFNDKIFLYNSYGIEIEVQTDFNSNFVELKTRDLKDGLYYIQIQKNNSNETVNHSFIKN